MSRPLGSRNSFVNRPHKIIRHILATRLYTDLACDKLDCRATEPYYEQAVGLKDGRNKGMPKVQDTDDPEQGSVVLQSSLSQAKSVCNLLARIY